MSPAVLGLTKEIATYMKRRIGAPDAEAAAAIHVPMNWTLDLLVDCNFAITVLQRASQNKGTFLEKIHVNVAYLLRASFNVLEGRGSRGGALPKLQW